MAQTRYDSQTAEMIVRKKMNELFGVENMEIYDCRLENGNWCITISFFPTRGQGYEETRRCCVDDHGEIHWVHPSSPTSTQDGEMI